MSDLLELIAEKADELREAETVLLGKRRRLDALMRRARSQRYSMSAIATATHGLYTRQTVFNRTERAA